MPEASSENQKSASEGLTENRDFRRRSVLWPGKLVIGKHELTCQVWNLSLGGARVRIDLPIQEGTDLKLNVASRGEIDAVVAWTEDGSLGLDFVSGPDLVRRMFEDRLHVLGLDEDTQSPA